MLLSTAPLLTTTAKPDFSYDHPPITTGGSKRVRLFSFYSRGKNESSAPVNPQRVRNYFRVALVLLTAFALWGWFRPYAWRPDPAARCKVAGVEVSRDGSYFWINVHLKVHDGQEHDLQKPVFLKIEGAGNLTPADTIFGGSKSHGTTDIWLKFWAEAADVAKPLSLRINDGSLRIKSSLGTPLLGDAESLHFTTHSW